MQKSYSFYLIWKEHIRRILSFWNHVYDYRPNCTLFSSTAIINLIGVALHDLIIQSHFGDMNRNVLLICSWSRSRNPTHTHFILFWGPRNKRFNHPRVKNLISLAMRIHPGIPPKRKINSIEIIFIDTPSPGNKKRKTSPRKNNLTGKRYRDCNVRAICHS